MIQWRATVPLQSFRIASMEGLRSRTPADRSARFHCALQAGTASLNWEMMPIQSQCLRGIRSPFGFGRNFARTSVTP